MCRNISRRQAMSKKCSAPSTGRVDPSDAESTWLTLSSQLQPRSSVPRDPTPEPTGLETSSGMVGRWVGALSRWFRLPWVPLLGAGFSPSRSAGGGGHGVCWVSSQSRWISNIIKHSWKIQEVQPARLLLN